MRRKAGPAEWGPVEQSQRNKEGEQNWCEGKMQDELYLDGDGEKVCEIHGCGQEPLLWLFPFWGPLYTWPNGLYSLPQPGPRVSLLHRHTHTSSS